MLTDEMRERIARAVYLHREGKLPDPPADFPWPERTRRFELDEASSEHDEKQAAILSAFARLGSAQAVAQHLSLPYEAVRRRLHQAGVPLTRGRMPGDRKKELSDV